MRLRTYVLAWLFALSLLGSAAMVISQSRGLPERVATHFTLEGRADGWMTREGEVATFLGLVTVGLPVFVAGMMYIIRFWGPESLNVPNAAHWRSLENHPRACAILFRHGLVLGAASSWWSVALHARLAAANRTVPPHLDGAAGLLLVLVAGIVLWIAALLLRFVRIPSMS